MRTKGRYLAIGTKAGGLREIVAPDADFHEGHLVAVVNHFVYKTVGKESKREDLPREQVEDTARLLAAAPWLELLAKCFTAGWSLKAEEGGFRLCKPTCEYIDSRYWKGGIIDADEDTYNAVAKALGVQP